MKRWLGVVVVFLLIAASTLAPRTASSQSIWLPREPGQSLTIEFLKPDINYGPSSEDDDFMTGALFLTSRFPVSGQKLSLILQLPYARYSGGATFGQTNQALGNAYIGLESHGTLIEEFGFYLPTSSGNAPTALAIGILSDVARREAYYDNAVSVQGALHYRRVTPSHFMVGLRVGPTVLFPTISGADPEVFANYSGRIGYEDRLFRAGAGLTGRIHVTASGVTGSERTQHQIEVHADVGSGVVRPGVELKVPLGDLGEAVDSVVGASLTFVL